MTTFCIAFYESYFLRYGHKKAWASINRSVLSDENYFLRFFFSYCPLHISLARAFLTMKKKTFYFLSNFLILHVNFACSLFSVSDIISLDNVDFNCRLLYYSFYKFHYCRFHRRLIKLSTCIPRVPQCLSPCPNWDNPTPSPASEWGGGSQFRRLEKKLYLPVL